ncbi:cupin domain-containing protein [Vibrio agarivorans]|uniref:Cupin domain-containing protein n=1 Tax=Vibrio agarivorans TaxID=153622 RepID=A0ABT7XYP7_9VIBR|nr:cupin domain-containing protein [Vibrio agarivorans]MDN2480907.1 cupin domain-containing protein [Vibrio agarivorans]
MLNMQFDKPVIINTSELDWLPSPKQGVWRKPLEREAAESGHVTSIVKYESGSSFSSHSHPLGEEIIVLDGVFSDEHGHYPAGSYLRNPPASAHTPFSQNGCTLFVKLNQMKKADKTQRRIALNLDIEPNGWVQPLHHFSNETVALYHWPAASSAPFAISGSRVEILILKGQLGINDKILSLYSWLRLNQQQVASLRPLSSSILWVKIIETE